MKSFGILILAAAAAFAQTAVFPGAVATDSQLRVAANQFVAPTLTLPITSSSTSATVTNAAGIVANSLVTIDNEHIAVCGVSGTTLSFGKSSCPNVDGRGFDGTAAAAHATGVSVYLNIDAWHHNSVAAEVKAMEAAMGVNFANLGIPSGSSPLAVASGGTGSTTASAARIALSIPDGSNPLAVASGGTGSTTAAAARIALSIPDGSNPLAVASGGTGSATATAARSALTAAKSGANSDITSLTALAGLNLGGTAVSVPTATGVPAVLGSFVDGVAASPQASNSKSSIIFQRVNALPSNIATAFTFDCSSTSAAGANLGCITINNAIHDVTIARGGTATRNTAYSDAPVAAAAILSATLSAGTVTVLTSSAHYATVGSPVMIAGTAGMTGLNSTTAYTVASAADSTHFTFACGGCSGGPATGGTASMPVAYFASWDSAWKTTGPNVRMVGRESDMNNSYADAGSDTSAQDATFNDAIYCQGGHHCTAGIYIDSGDAGTSKFYSPLKFGPNALIAGRPYIDSSAGPNNVDFGWAGNNQFLRWADTAAGRWPVLGLDVNNNFRVSAPTGYTIAAGPNLANVLQISATITSSRQATTLAKTANYIGSETGANNAIAGALLDAGGLNVALAAGLEVTVKLGHTLQAGANTFNLNAGGAVNIKSSRNASNNIATAYAVTGTVTLLYDGTQWVDVSQ